MQHYIDLARDAHESGASGLILFAGSSFVVLAILFLTGVALFDGVTAAGKALAKRWRSAPTTTARSDRP